METVENPWSRPQFLIPKIVTLNASFSYPLYGFSKFCRSIFLMVSCGFPLFSTTALDHCWNSWQGLPALPLPLPSTLHLALAKARIWPSHFSSAPWPMTRVLNPQPCQMHLRALKHAWGPTLRDEDGGSSVYLKAVPMSHSVHILGWESLNVAHAPCSTALITSLAPFLKLWTLNIWLPHNNQNTTSYLHVFALCSFCLDGPFSPRSYIF